MFENAEFLFWGWIAVSIIITPVICWLFFGDTRGREYDD